MLITGKFTMRRSVAKYITICSLLFSNALFGMNPDEFFDSGMREFKLSRWRECVEIFDKLNRIWPDYENKYEALYYRTIAAIRDLDKKVTDYRAEQTDIIVKDCEILSSEISDKDMSELKAAVAISKLESKPIDWLKQINIKPEELKHYLLRGRHPNPSKEPLITIQWIVSYEKNGTVKEPELKSMLNLLKLKALWQMLLSPIVAETEKSKLIDLNIYPLGKTFEKTLNDGFRQSKNDLKREFARSENGAPENVT